MTEILVDVTARLEYTEVEFSQDGKQVNQVGKTVPIEITEKGLLIPREVLGKLDEGELEAVREKGRIVIRPKLDRGDEQARVGQVLRAAGLLYEPEWEQPSPVSEQERANLAKELASGSSLSNAIIADREDRA